MTLVFFESLALLEIVPGPISVTRAYEKVMCCKRFNIIISNRIAITRSLALKRYPRLDIAD